MEQSVWTGSISAELKSGFRNGINKSKIDNFNFFATSHILLQDVIRKVYCSQSRAVNEFSHSEFFRIQ